jgi:hypothetical protein
MACATLRITLRAVEATTLLDRDVADFIALGVAVVVATRDADLHPEIARGWGPIATRDGACVRLCLVLRDGSTARANLEANGAIAATFSRPTTYRTVQIKGSAREVADPTPEDGARAQAHLAAFVAEAEQVGVPPDGARRLFGASLVAVEFAVAQVFDQTPGPTAGTRL